MPDNSLHQNVQQLKKLLEDTQIKPKVLSKTLEKIAEQINENNRYITGVSFAASQFVDGLQHTEMNQYSEERFKTLFTVLAQKLKRPEDIEYIFAKQTINKITYNSTIAETLPNEALIELWHKNPQKVANIVTSMATKRDLHENTNVGCNPLIELDAVEKIFQGIATKSTSSAKSFLNEIGKIKNGTEYNQEHFDGITSACSRIIQNTPQTTIVGDIFKRLGMQKSSDYVGRIYKNAMEKISPSNTMAR